MMMVINIKVEEDKTIRDQLNQAQETPALTVEVQDIGQKSAHQVERTMIP